MGTLKVLISGGAGFIGSHLTERLVSEGHDVTVIDNLSTGSIENLDQVFDDIEFICSDVEICDIDGDFDRIFHLASVANPTDYMGMQLSVLSSASIGTEKLLDLSRRSGSRFYYFSSSEVYGSHGPGGSHSEDSNSNVRLLTQRSAYLVAKMFGEQLTRSYGDRHGLDVRIIRPFNIYGPRMDVISPYGRVMTNFLRRAIGGEPLEVNGDGLQTRSFCHVYDFIDGLMMLDSIGGDVPVVNIGNPDPITIGDLAELIISITGSHSEVVNVESVRDEPRYRCPNISLMNELCGWSPKISLHDGLMDMYHSMSS